MFAYTGPNGGLLYTIFTVYVSSAALFIFNLTQFKKKRELLSGFSQTILSRQEDNDPKKRAQRTLLLVIIEIALISLFQHGLCSPLNLLAGEIFQTGSNYWGMIIPMPILLPFYCWIVGVDPFKQIDLITPAYPLALFFMKIGCYFGDCCRGITCTVGSTQQQITVPIQLIEAVIALGLFFFLLRRRKKAKEGTLLPTYIILYCAIRFFTEFLRSDNYAFFGLRPYHLLSLFGVFYGAVLLIFVQSYKDAILRLFRKTLPDRLFSSKKK